MAKYSLSSLRILIGTAITFAIAFLLNFSTASAERVYCTTHNNNDYYIETDELSGTRSGLTYVGVYLSNGEHYTWVFDSFKEWTYDYWKGGMGGSGRGWRKVSESKVANDILYVTLNEKKKMSH